MRNVFVTFAACLVLLANGLDLLNGQGSFVNWESPHIAPLDVTDNGMILAVNTADNRLEVIDPFLGVVDSIPVGLDPVSVRARNAIEAWVVNHLSDSISIIDLSTGNVVKTLYPGDEPTDVVFAGTPQRAFVSVSQRNQIAVFDPANTDNAPVIIEIEGEDPRALATDGQRVYAAIFESGNKTMSINENDVSAGFNNPYPGDPNPPPNFGNGFNPPIAPGLPTPPETSIIVQKNEQSQWMDDNGGNWSNWANSRGFDMHDHDVAIIDANNLSVSYATGLMNANMAIAVRPTGGAIVVGTDATNVIRYEPNLTSSFVRVLLASINNAGATDAIQDLNPHLDYSTHSIPQNERVHSVGDPRGVAWSPSGDHLYVTGMGSNNLIELDSDLNRVRRLPIGQGPTGIHVGSDLIYVLNRFEATISIIDRDSFSELSRLPFYDPTPNVIRSGRPFLYNTHLTSGLGQASCGSCHIDARTDKLAWDLGNPAGEVKMFDQVCDIIALCEDWHPMKGPLLTQTLVGLDSAEPFHWRGDRGNFQQFNPTFVELNGRETELSIAEMSAFENFVMTIKFPPNPNRNIDDSMPTTFPNGGDAAMGQTIFNFGLLDNPFECSDCHAGAIGSNLRITPGIIDQEAQSMKVPQLRNLHERTGRDDTSANNNSGYGFVHDGSFDTLFSFFSIPAFSFANDQEIRDIVAFMMCFGEDFHAAIGTQVTAPSTAPGAATTIEQLVDFANDGHIGLVVKGRIGEQRRGWVWMAGMTFQSDRENEQFDLNELLTLATDGNELTFTAVPFQSAARIGVDRDEDGFFDRDELDACSNPADPSSTPENVLIGDVNQDGFINLLDVDPFIAALSAGVYFAPADINCDGFVNLLDVDPFVVLLGGG